MVGADETEGRSPLFSAQNYRTLGRGLPDAEQAKLTGLDGPEHAAQWKAWCNAAATVHARDAGLNRATLEAEVKKAVRHPDPGNS